jgi:hypothetical protein
MIEKGRLSRWHPKERQGEGGRIARGNRLGECYWILKK